MVFEDDFSDGSTRWETTDSDSWTLTKQNGRATWGSISGRVITSQRFEPT